MDGSSGEFDLGCANPGLKAKNYLVANMKLSATDILRRLFDPVNVKRAKDPFILAGDIP